MSIGKQAIEVLCQNTIKAVEDKVKKAPFDKCVQGRIVSKNNKMYNVKILGTVYTVPSLNDIQYNINDAVWIIKINGNEDNKYILGRM